VIVAAFLWMFAEEKTLCASSTAVSVVTACMLDAQCHVRLCACAFDSAAVPDGKPHDGDVLHIRPSPGCLSRMPQCASHQCCLACSSAPTAAPPMPLLDWPGPLARTNLRIETGCPRRALWRFARTVRRRLGLLRLRLGAQAPGAALLAECKPNPPASLVAALPCLALPWPVAAVGSESRCTNVLYRRIVSCAPYATQYCPCWRSALLDLHHDMRPPHSLCLRTLDQPGRAAGRRRRRCGRRMRRPSTRTCNSTSSAVEPRSGCLSSLTGSFQK
jgi:hypothetical protein